MITVLGASGKTGFKTAEQLLKKGEKVRVVGRTTDHLNKLIEKGADPYIGDQRDVDFLAQCLSGSNAVYAMIPPKMDSNDIREYYHDMGLSLVEAVKKSGIKKVVFLSSFGAEHEYGTGPVMGLHDVETMLDKINNVDVVFLRVGYFFENILWEIGSIKSRNLISNSMSPDATVHMVATKDIAKKASELLLSRSFKGHSIVELYGHRISFKEITKIIGEKIGLSNLKYVQATVQEAIQAMTSMGMSQNVAESFTQLSKAISNGRIQPTTINPMNPNGSTNFDQFAEEVFVPAYRGTGEERSEEHLMEVSA